MSPKSLVSLVAALVILNASAPGAWAAPAKTPQENELIEAAYAGLLPKVQKLLAAGVSIEAQDENGYTALHWAAQSGWPLTTQALIARGADVNAKDKQGRTPLLLATVRASTEGQILRKQRVKPNHVKVAKVLFDRGADPYAKDNGGLSAHEYAKVKRLTALSTLFARAPKPTDHGDEHGHATPKPAAPKPAAHGSDHGHAMPKPAAPKPVAHGNDHGHAMPKPAAPKPVAHGNDHGTAGHAAGEHALGTGHDASHHLPVTGKPAEAKAALPSPARPAPVQMAAGRGSHALSAPFKTEISRLYSSYNELVGTRDPESHQNAGLSHELENRIEQVFNLLSYGGKNSVSKTRLKEARGLVSTLLKQVEGDPKLDKAYVQTLDGVNKALTSEGY